MEQPESVVDSMTGRQVSVRGLPPMDSLQPNYLHSAATNATGVSITQAQVQQHVQAKQKQAHVQQQETQV